MIPLEIQLQKMKQADIDTLKEAELILAKAIIQITELGVIPSIELKHRQGKLAIGQYHVEGSVRICRPRYQTIGYIEQLIKLENES